MHFIAFLTHSMVIAYHILSHYLHFNQSSLLLTILLMSLLLTLAINYFTRMWMLQLCIIFFASIVLSTCLVVVPYDALLLTSFIALFLNFSFLLFLFSFKLHNLLFRRSFNLSNFSESEQHSMTMCFNFFIVHAMFHVMTKGHCYFSLFFSLFLFLLFLISY